MTYSIVARDADTGELGAAIQSKAFCCGVGTLWVESGVGAVATQSFSDPSYGPLCLLALRSGATAAAALAGATRRDRLSPYRQVGVVAATGTSAAFTGRACIPQAGHVHRTNVSCQANMMDRATVWPAMLETFRGATGTLAERLVAALEAAQAEGGDWRGQEAGRVLVVSGDPSGSAWRDVVCDVRVDNHPKPVAELRRLVLRNQALRTAAAAGAKSVAAAVAAAAAAGLEEPHVTIAALRTAVSTGEVDAARAHLDRLLVQEPRYLELVRRLPDIPEMLGIEPMLPIPADRPAVSRPGAGRAGSPGRRSGPARR